MTDAAEIRTLEANGLRMQVAVAGEGPLVLLCHGWPETWRCWRHQIPVLADAGFRVAAPDMRGFGGSEAPQPVDAYTLLHLVGDMTGLVQALGETRAIIVGHDWGAMVAWHAALLRPDVCTAVCGMSVPYAPPSARSTLDALKRLGINNFYIQYFQAEGVAEAELDPDSEDALARIYFTASGDTPEGATFVLVPPEGLLAKAPRPPEPLSWLDTEELKAAAEAFRHTGFRGGLNWYRNMDRNRDLLAPWRGLPIRQPSLFVAGDRDGVLRFPGSRSAMDAYPQTLPGLRGSVMVEGAGHWVQQERPEAVNATLLDFLRSLD